MTAANESSGKTYRTVEIELPCLGKQVIGPTNLPEAGHLVDESKGGFRALARQPQEFLPQSYIGGLPTGFGYPPSASNNDLPPSSQIRAPLKQVIDLTCDNDGEVIIPR